MSHVSYPGNPEKGGKISMKLGNLAAHREEQIIEWALENEEAAFTEQDVVHALYSDGDRPIHPYVFEAFRVACRDLQRKQILKGLASVTYERFVLNTNGKELAAYLEEKNKHG